MVSGVARTVQQWNRCVSKRSPHPLQATLLLPSTFSSSEFDLEIVFSVIAKASQFYNSVSNISLVSGLPYQVTQ